MAHHELGVIAAGLPPEVDMHADVLRRWARGELLDAPPHVIEVFLGGGVEESCEAVECHCWWRGV